MRQNRTARRIFILPETWRKLLKIGGKRGRAPYIRHLIEINPYIRQLPTGKISESLSQSHRKTSHSIPLSDQEYEKLKRMARIAGCVKGQNNPNVSLFIDWIIENEALYSDISEWYNAEVLPSMKKELKEMNNEPR